MWLAAAIWRKWILRLNSDDYRLITVRFGRQMHNRMPMTTHRSKSKPELKVQYGGRPLSENLSRFVSDVDCEISYKFGRQIYFHIRKQIPSLHMKQEVHFPLHRRRREKLIWRHNFDAHILITRKLGRYKQNDLAMTMKTWDETRNVSSMWRLSGLGHAN